MATTIKNVFTYYVTKDKKVIISWQGKQVMILRNKDAEKFIAKINDASKDAQMIMAKVTGNFKRGNEKNRN